MNFSAILKHQRFVPSIKRSPVCFSPISNRWNGLATNFRPKEAILPTSFPAYARYCSVDVFKEPKNLYQKNLRNVGISAHIDSGKTTLTERVLFYTGRIDEIHEVKGKDGVGAKMDFMDLEREKGITIQSAATHCTWGDSKINIIDTPGHVDFTIEVERALRVLDGAVLVMCGVSGVQSQTITVDRQMRRYNVPRVVFINKLDRVGSDPWRVVDQLRQKLKLNAAALQVPIGLEHNLKGVVDLIRNEAVYFDGKNGETIRREAKIPDLVKATAQKKREELIEVLADADDEFAEKVMEGADLVEQDFVEAIRRATLAHKFTPVTMGSALKNTGVQLLLDSVINYLPNPTEIKNTALDVSNHEEPVVLPSDVTKPFVGLAFKLEESRHGQLTYVRVYQGMVNRGDFIYNIATGKKTKVPRLVRMHARDMEDIQSVGAGEICAMFGIECASGTTFTNGNVKYAMTSMHIPDPVLSLAVDIPQRDQSSNFSKAMSKFQREDPTFKCKVDSESGQTIISGMGELHLEVYLERLKREYGVDAVTGKPRVAFRETVTSKGTFDYTHKKQSGGAGQYGKVCGFVEPFETEENEEKTTEFVDAIVGNAIPPQFLPAVQKGFEDALQKGPLIGHPIQGVRMVVNDGASHPVDSNEMAFRICSANAFRAGMMNANPAILEPIMTVEISSPIEFQGSIISGLNRRKGVIVNSETREDYCIIVAEVPLNNMFGYSTDLRSNTQGKGEFSMEYKHHALVPRELQQQLVEDYKKQQQKPKK